MKNFLKDESGAALAEYAMLLAVIAVALISAVVSLRDEIVGTFNRAATALQVPK